MQALVIEAKKLPKLPNQDTESIKQMLRYVFGLIGIEPAKIPDEAEKLILLDYMKNNMAYFSILDVKNAFTLYVQGKLDFNEKHFHKFSVLFLENVMQSYNRYRMRLDVWKQEALKAPDPSPEQIEEIHREATIKKFNHYKKTSEIQDPGNPSFNWLYQKRIMKYTEEDYLDFGQKAKSRLKNAARNKAAAGMLKSKLTTVLESYENGNNIKSEAKRLVLADFFQSLIDNNQHIEQVI